MIRSLPPSLYDDLLSLALRTVFFGRAWGGRGIQYPFVINEHSRLPAP